MVSRNGEATENGRDDNKIEAKQESNMAAVRRHSKASFEKLADSFSF
jgi:hypothetical protein